jgi:hypothetical protein
MTRLPVICLIALAAGFLGSCGTSGSGEGAAESSANLAPLSQRLNQEQGYVRDSEGNWIPRSNKRSQFESISASGTDRRNNMANRRFKANEYQAAEWTRTKSAPPQGYVGDTDGSAFQTTAAAQGQAARQSGDRARIPGAYETGTFGTGSSRENQARRHDRPQDDQTENRRGKFTPPEIIDWRQQRDLSIDQSRSILSR